MNNPAEKLSQKKRSLSVAIMRYTKLRAKLPDANIGIVEGDEDVIFYSTIFKRSDICGWEFFFPAYGKENVIGLRNYITHSREVLRTGKELFFVDKDFDGLKGVQDGCDIYVTSTYSIENILVDREILRKILFVYFKLMDADSIGDIERILGIYDELIEHYKVALYEANRLIHFVRKRSLGGERYTSGSINDDNSKFVRVNHEDLSVRKIGSGVELIQLISVSRDIDQEVFDSLKGDFDELDPIKEWRGKFLFYIFQCFISKLIEDRNSRSPRHFSKGVGKISLDVKTDSFFSMLSSICEIPDCLNEFIDKSCRAPSALPA